MPGTLKFSTSMKLNAFKRNFNKSNALALNLGINNLVTAVSNRVETFIIDGRRLKSINQWFNKENARLQSIKEHADLR